MISFNNQRKEKEKELSQLKNTKPKSLEREIQFNPIFFCSDMHQPKVQF